MLGFSSEQREVKLGNITIGGQPGKNPTLLLGTVLYGKKYRTLNDDNRNEAKKFIEVQREVSEKTGVWSMVDVYLPSSETARQRLEFVIDHLEEGEFISIDVPESEVRTKALKILSEMGFLQRTLLNSINLGITEEERKALEDNTPASAILLAYDPRDMSTHGRLNMIKNGTREMEEGFLDLSERLGMLPIIDTAATPFEHSAAETLRAIPVFKEDLGIPVGCSIHNIVESWRWMKKYKKENKGIYLYSDVGSAGLPLTLGADFLVYGPIRNAGPVFPYVAFVDKIIGEGGRDYFGVEAHERHPVRRLP